GREGERVAGQPRPERRQLERADRRCVASDAIDVAGAPSPSDGDGEDAPQSGEHNGEVEAELPVEVLARLAQRALHDLGDLEPQMLHAFILFCSFILTAVRTSPAIRSCPGRGCAAPSRALGGPSLPRTTSARPPTWR